MDLDQGPGRFARMGLVPVRPPVVPPGFARPPHPPPPPTIPDGLGGAWFGAVSGPIPESRPEQSARQDGIELDLYAESQRPYQAAMWTSRREESEKTASSTGEKKARRFGKLDLISLILAKSLSSKAAVLEYVQMHGTEEMQQFVCNNQSKLKVWMEQAEEWGQATSAAASERESDWMLVCRTAAGTCPNGPQCGYACAAAQFFQANSSTISRDSLAAALRDILNNGPSKTTRVPLIVGPTNSGKTTIVKPFVDLFGFKHVFHQPARNSNFALRNLLHEHKRFIFWDDYRPVELRDQSGWGGVQPRSGGGPARLSRHAVPPPLGPGGVVRTPTDPERIPGPPGCQRPRTPPMLDLEPSDDIPPGVCAVGRGASGHVPVPFPGAALRSKRQPVLQRWQRGHELAPRLLDDGEGRGAVDPSQGRQQRGRSTHAKPRGAVRMHGAAPGTGLAGDGTVRPVHVRVDRGGGCQQGLSRGIPVHNPRQIFLGSGPTGRVLVEGAPSPRTRGLVSHGGGRPWPRRTLLARSGALRRRRRPAGPPPVRAGPGAWPALPASRSWRQRPPCPPMLPPRCLRSSWSWAPPRSGRQLGTKVKTADNDLIGRQKFSSDR